jgi:hypothetical protein
MYRVSGRLALGRPQTRAGGEQGEATGPFEKTYLVFLLVFRLDVVVDL